MQVYAPFAHIHVVCRSYDDNGFSSSGVHYRGIVACVHVHDVCRSYDDNGLSSSGVQCRGMQLVYTFTGYVGPMTIMV